MGRPFEKTPIFEGRSIDPLLFSPLLFLITNEKTIFLAKFEKIHPRFSRFPPSKMPRKNKQERERESGVVRQRRKPRESGGGEVGK